MLYILGMIILIIILFIIILLLFGIKIVLEYNKKGHEVKGCLKILIFKKIRIYTHNLTETDEKEDSPEEDDDTDHNIRKIYELAKPCMNDLYDYIRTILSKIRISKMRNHIIFGMTSYADTGKYIGIIWAILAAVNGMNEKLELSAEPSFNGSTLDAIGSNEVEIYPLKLIIPTVKLISKKEVRRLIRGVIDVR